MTLQEQKKMLNVLKEIADTGVKATKQTLMVDNNDTPYVKLAIKYLLDPFEMVGLSTKKVSKDVTPNKSIIDFDKLIEYLHENPTGRDVDIAVVKGYLSQFEDETEYNQMFELLTKTMSIGVSAKSANKAYGGGFIRIFDVQLAFAYEKKIQMYNEDDRFYVTQKLDGYRALTTIDTSNKQITITTYTRKGAEIEGLSELHTDIIEFISTNPNIFATFKDGFVLDGELLLHNDNDLTTDELFRATSKALRKTGEKKNIEYNIFDLLPLSDFLTKEESEKTYEYRREEWLNGLTNTNHIKVVQSLAEITKDDIPTWSQYATEHAWEGVMLNVADGKYKKTRSAKLLKVKKMHTADLEIVGYNEAIDGKYKGKLKSIQVRLDENNTVDVSSGLTDEIRDEIWNNQDKYLGKMIEIQYFEETENQDGGKSLRFPVFKQFRFDKTPDDANID